MATSEEKIDIHKKGKRGGWRGGGRPKGKRSAATLEKEAILRAYRQRVMGITDDLLNSQLILARGMTYLYKIEKEEVIGPKGGKSYRKKKPELVTDQWELEQFLENKIGDTYNDDPGNPAATYYFLTTKDPDPRAIEDMMNRTYGKSIQAIDLNPPDEKYDDFEEEQIEKIAKRFIKTRNTTSKKKPD